MLAGSGRQPVRTVARTGFETRIELRSSAAQFTVRALDGRGRELSLSQPVQPPGGIHKIKHVVVIMQENRSFDCYFGTYPGADGIPMRHGTPTVCVPDPQRHRCVRPFHDPPTSTAAGRTGANAGRRHQRRQDGRLRQQAQGGRRKVRRPDRPGLHESATAPT